MVGFSTRVGLAAVAVCGLLAACSESKSVGSATAPIATIPGVLDSSAATAPSTEPPPTTTTAASISVAVTSTSVAAAEALVLRAGGVGPFDLGSAAEQVVTGISGELGAPTRDDTVDYPVADGQGEYTTAEGDTGFVAPIGRTVCWSANLCVEFGGASVVSMSFTGWTYTNDPLAALSSASGGTIGARWSDLSAMEVAAGGCYSVGSGTIDDIRVTLESSGDLFSSFDDAGNYITAVPSPADVTITRMETGKTPIFLFGDC